MMAKGSGCISSKLSRVDTTDAYGQGQQARRCDAKTNPEEMRLCELRVRDSSQKLRGPYRS